MDTMEIIKARHSVRQYEDRMIEPKLCAQLHEYATTLNKESGLNIQLITNEPKCFNSLMAHYGRFSGVSNYIAIVGRKGDDTEEKVGYYGEQLVLKAQELGLNTCWVALTHGKSTAVIGNGEKLYIIISVGYGKSAGVAHKSKDITKLAVLSDDDPQWYIDGVQAALLAPTAVNQQKFMIERVDEEARITAPKGMLTLMDLGIVKCHFELASGHKTI